MDVAPEFTDIQISGLLPDIMITVARPGYAGPLCLAGLLLLLLLLLLSYKLAEYSRRAKQPKVIAALNVSTS